MPYELTKDPHASASNTSPGRKLVLVTPGTPPDTYFKALRVYSAGGCTVTVLAVDDPDGATQVLTFPAGLFFEPLSVRDVTAATNTPIIHGYTK